MTKARKSSLDITTQNQTNSELLGNSLIFLISQPRAGSTLLQRMLGAHPDIHTTSEPWLMLHPLYALRPDGYEAEYNADWAQSAVRDFLQALPGGEDEYLEGVRCMYTYLYERALTGSGKRYFLDKTPRYYFVIPELYRLFPEARFIILLRNPLAVLCSILKTWTKENWFLLYNHKHDLLRAPRLLLEGMELLGERGVIVRYEQLVREPDGEVLRICSRLGIDFVPEMIEYGDQDISRWRFGDQEGVYQHSRPVLKSVEKWEQALDNPQVWRLARDYLKLIGKEIIEKMGYSYEELRQVLEEHRPSRVRLWFTFSLAWLLKRPLEEHKKWMRGIVRLRMSLRRRGIWGTTVAVARRAVYALPNPK